jgi:hypothetical protein
VSILMGGVIATAHHCSAVSLTPPTTHNILLTKFA